MFLFWHLSLNAHSGMLSLRVQTAVLGSVGFVPVALTTFSYGGISLHPKTLNPKPHGLAFHWETSKSSTLRSLPETGALGGFPRSLQTGFES